MLILSAPRARTTPRDAPPTIVVARNAWRNFFVASSQLSRARHDDASGTGATDHRIVDARRHLADIPQRLRHVQRTTPGADHHRVGGPEVRWLPSQSVVAGRNP
jgi:hypothetical protein